MSEETILLKDAKFVVSDASKTGKDLSIGIRGGLITGVGESDELEVEGPFDEVLDCRGQVLLPGLINTHTHIHETMMRGLGHDLPFHDWCDRLVFPAAEAMEDEGDGMALSSGYLTSIPGGFARLSPG